MHRTNLKTNNYVRIIFNRDSYCRVCSSSSINRVLHAIWRAIQEIAMKKKQRVFINTSCATCAGIMWKETKKQWDIYQAIKTMGAPCLQYATAMDGIVYTNQHN